ncbi:cell envelope protein [Sinorhizobium sp. LM21]|nr:cell envelope protein [Sinorhizobium sp. LM21]
MLKRRSLLMFGALATALPAFKVTRAGAADSALTAHEARAIAKDAYIYGFPLVDSYRVQHSYFVDHGNPEFKSGWNALNNTARVYTPDDKAIQTPNSDTPYSFLGADLRAEPLVLTVPAVEKERYYSLQFVDMYTFNFAYVGSRATGSEAGTFLLAGPGWKGETPPGIKAVIRSETEFAFVLYRTQMFDPADIENVKKIQAGYRVEPLSSFLGQPAPAPAAAVDFIAPLSAADEKTSPDFYRVLNFILQYCPTHPSETALMQRFADLNIGAGKTFDITAFSPEIQKAITDGMADAWAAFKEHKETEIDTGKASSADAFGTREFLKNDYMQRMSGAVLGIYGNSKDEALYPAYFVDDQKKPLTGSGHYTLRFEPGQLPPVNAFWSLTLYELPSSLLYANPLNRYLINSPMLPNLQKDADGGVTLYVQHESPGLDKEANWLPAPSGPFFTAMRLYWPKPDALDGKWKAPPMRRAN